MSLIYNEIHGQYDALKRCKRYLDDCFGEIHQLLAVGYPPLVVFMGCGPNFALARSMSDAFQMRMGRPCYAVPAGDVTLHAAHYARMMEGATIILLSRSGKTSELLFALDSLEEKGCHFQLVSISCVAQCGLSAYSALALEMPWCFDRSICQTRTVSCLYYSVMYLLARLSGDEALCNQLANFPDRGRVFVERYEGLWQQLASLPWNHVAVLADAEVYGLAEEGSLFFNALCQLPSNCHHVLDVRHGAKVLFLQHTLVIAVLEGRKLEYDLMQELAGQGATVSTISDGPIPLAQVASFVIGEPVDHILRGLYAIVLCQMLAFYKAENMGINPDSPHGLEACIRL